MAERMCFGEWVRDRPTDVDRATELLSGTLRLGRHRLQTLAEDPTWDEDPLGDANWQFLYHALYWVDVLRRAWAVTGDEQMRERYRFLLRDWVQDNPYTHPLPAPSEPPFFPWFDMAVGLRAIVLACAVDALGQEPWLVDALSDHANALADPVQYGVGNHAMHQNNGLFTLACIGRHEQWQDLAELRNREMLSVAVDPGGVSNEGSFGYQINNYRWWSEARERLVACDRAPDPLWDRVSVMPDAMPHMTAPDGYFEIIGDTVYGAWGSNLSSELDWVTSRGTRGSPPIETVVVYETAGYVMGRSGWGTERSVDEESYWTLRFGPTLRATVHGHEDHGSITLAAFGSRLLWDQGMYAYYGGERRAYVRSNEAHNSIDIEGAAYSDAAESLLRVRQHGSGWDFFVVDVSALADATWSRALFASRTSHYLIVRDRVSQALDRAVIQRWHLDQGRLTTFDARRLDTSGDGANLSIVWPVRRPSVEVIEGRESPLLGWRSLEYGELIPVPVVEARTSGNGAELLTVLLPRASGVDPTAVDVVSADPAADGYDVTVRIGTACETVRFGEESADVVSPLSACP